MEALLRRLEAASLNEQARARLNRLGYRPTRSHGYNSGRGGELMVEIEPEFRPTEEDSLSVSRMKIKGYQVQKEIKKDSISRKQFSQDVVVEESRDDLIRINSSQFRKKFPHLSDGDMVKLTFRGTRVIRAVFEEYDERNKDIMVFSRQKKIDDLDDLVEHRINMYRNCYFEFDESNMSNTRKIEATRMILASPHLTHSLSPELIQDDHDEFEHLIPGLDELTSDNIICYNDQMVKEQRQAVIDILKANNRPYPYILFGPPGTGKTAVLTELVIQIYKRSPEAKILFVSNANISADSIASKLLANGEIKDEHIMRFVSTSRYRTTNVNCPKVRPSSLIDVEMMPRIVVATCNMTLLLKDDDHFSYEFDFVIVDEAGHAQEPEALIPITLVKNNGSIVLAGDPYQLSPLVFDSELKDLEESILDRLFKMPLYSKNGSSYNRRYITKLLQCHRSDPRLFRVNNRRFYDGELISSYTSDPNILNILHTTDPMIFDQLKGNQRQRGTSFLNDEQATRCVDYAQLLYQSNIRPDDIGIICGYKAQVGIVLDELKSRIMVPCKVATFDEFQGEERKVIIICTVRSSAGYNSNRGQRGLGFLKDSKRFNVATTRARDVTIVIGDAEVLDGSWDWREYTKNAFNVSTRLPR